MTNGASRTQLWYVTPRGGTFTTSGNSNPGLQHAFNAVVGPDGNVYVANQGDSTKPQTTNAVTAYLASRGDPMPLSNPPYRGTFVPPAGVESGRVEVLRGLLFAQLPATPGSWHLSVSDEGATTGQQQVRVYEWSSGQSGASIVTAADGLQSPIHLLLDPTGSSLYIGDEGSRSCDTVSRMAHPIHRTRSSRYRQRRAPHWARAINSPMTLSSSSKCRRVARHSGVFRSSTCRTWRGGRWKREMSNATEEHEAA